MTDLLIQEAWGDHEALLIKPPKSRGRVPPPVPAQALVASGFHLEYGGTLPELRLRYETYGQLNSDRSNVVLVFHAWTGSAHLAGTYTKETLLSLYRLDKGLWTE